VEGGRRDRGKCRHQFREEQEPLYDITAMKMVGDKLTLELSLLQHSIEDEKRSSQFIPHVARVAEAFEII
jgi:hypothetical protein